MKIRWPPRPLGLGRPLNLAAAYAGMTHVGNPADFLRVVTVNGVAALVYGWLYWRRGLELAILNHMVVTACLYIAVPAFR